ncbi:MAG: transglutaminase-like putative cysteine protease [Desulforhopalus sp.]|jgi:transglutaminase-like putative cysteine protease
MITSPLLIASAAIFWGIESGNLIVGAILAIVIAIVVFVPTKWKLTDENSVNVSDLTSVIFVAATVLIFLNVDAVVFLKTLVIWLPLVLLPLISAQLYSGREKIVIGTRLGSSKKRVHKHKPLDFRIYYIATCLLSAAMANSRSPLFFPCAGIMLFWLLVLNRGKGFSRLTFVMVFLLAVGGGYLALKGAEFAHGYVSQKTRLFIRGYYHSKHADPFQAHLSFGSIGRLKTSGKIVLRLKAEGTPPTLLKLASYETFNRFSWHSSQPYQDLVPNNLIWDLLPGPQIPDKHATIEYYLPKERGLLPHPKGSYQVDGPTIYELQQKADGITKIIDGAPLITYEIYYNSSLIRETDQPSRRNLAVHPEENKVLEKLVKNWQLKQLSSQERVSKIQQFFADGFIYTLTLEGKGRYSSSFENFLLGSRAGYCELFATATTLLLRKAGIASRYVTGYAVTEKSTFEKKYIVRQRHAHAWSEAYINGRWLVVDTTPTDWLSLDSKSRSKFEKITDFLAYLRLKYEHFRIETENNYKVLLSLLVIILAVVLVYRIYRRIDKKTISTKNAKNLKTFKVVDSPLYQVEQRLLQMGIVRYKNEPFLFWLKRINEVRKIEIETIKKMYALHMRLRFDPAGLNDDEQRYLKEQTDQWLKSNFIAEDTEHN